LKAALLVVLPYLVLLIPITVLGVLGQRAVGADLESFAPMSRARAVWYAFGHHAAVMLFAEEPTARYAPWPWPPRFPGTADFAGLALLLAVMGALLFCRGERQRPARIGAAFAALTYLPVSSLLFPLTRYLADTYVYLPLIGMGWLLGALLDEARARFAGVREAWFRALPWLAGVALAPLFLVSSARFESDLALWAQARARFPQHPRICRQWSNAAYKREGAALGLAALDACIADFGPELFEKNRGILLAQLGRTDEAREWLRAAARKSPSDPVIQSYLQQLEQR
jgi:tetratricopeptide (TPR) repeat protein